MQIKKNIKEYYRNWERSNPQSRFREYGPKASDVEAEGFELGLGTKAKHGDGVLESDAGRQSRPHSRPATSKSSPSPPHPRRFSLHPHPIPAGYLPIRTLIPAGLHRIPGKKFSSIEISKK